MGDLRNVRDFLASEGERVQREIQSYAQLSQVAMTSVKIIADKQYGGVAAQPGQLCAD